MTPDMPDTDGEHPDLTEEEISAALEEMDPCLCEAVDEAIGRKAAE